MKKSSGNASPTETFIFSAPTGGDISEPCGITVARLDDTHASALRATTDSRSSAEPKAITWSPSASAASSPAIAMGSSTPDTPIWIDSDTSSGNTQYSAMVAIRTITVRNAHSLSRRYSARSLRMIAQTMRRRDTGRLIPRAPSPSSR